MSNPTEPAPFVADPAHVVNRYVAVWSEPDPGARRSAIAELWTPGGVEFVEGGQFRGHEELDARIANAYTEFVGSGRYTVASADDVTVHHDIITFTIQLIGNGDRQLAWAARVFLLVDESGLVRADYQLTTQPLAG